MFRKILTVSIIIFIISTCFSTPSFAANDISLVIDNQYIQCDVPPIAVNGRTLVPVRALFEYLDARVTWDDILGQVLITSETAVIILNLESNIASVNGNSVTLDAAPVVINGRTLVPIRFISETLGYSISWDGSSRTVYVMTSGVTSSVNNFQNSSSSNVSSDMNIEIKPNPSLVSTLSSVNVTEDNNYYTVNITISSQITPSVMTLSDPYRLIFDFKNSVQSCKDGSVKSSSGIIKETRWASHPEYSRVVIESAVKCSYTMSYTSANILTIVVTKPQGSEISQETAPAQPEATVPVVAVPSGAPLVVIDAGHGGGDPGAIGRDSAGNDILYEKTVCLQIANKVKAMLEANGISVLMTRTNDVSLGETQQIDLDTRAQIGNNSNASLFVSIHNNAFTSSEASGACVLYAGLASHSDYGITGKDLAQNIQTQIIKSTGLRDRGVIERPNLVVLRKTKMPAALVECAFITNPGDQQILGSDAGQNEMADAICQGILISLRQMGKIN